MSAVTDAAIQALVKIQQKMCTNPPPAADEAVKILKCCPMRKFFVSTILYSVIVSRVNCVFAPFCSTTKIAVKDL